mmetsp:Transcript_34218/g.90790  ORF Transcript_34218/g.90790 Transcript_34218/m.90790 type:complete len:204 (+) Transcript_34218:626-1237(+)
MFVQMVFTIIRPMVRSSLSDKMPAHTCLNKPSIFLTAEVSLLLEAFAGLSATWRSCFSSTSERTSSVLIPIAASKPKMEETTVKASGARFRPILSPVRSQLFTMARSSAATTAGGMDLATGAVNACVRPRPTFTAISADVAPYSAGTSASTSTRFRASPSTYSLLSGYRADRRPATCCMSTRATWLATCAEANLATPPLSSSS